MELTKEQLEQAVEAFRGTDVYSIRDGIIAAAPFLQMPIAEVTQEELIRANRKFTERESRMPVGVEGINEAIRNRNAALLPKPDLREQIYQVIYKSTDECVGSEVLTDRILAIIDAHKGGE